MATINQTTPVYVTFTVSQKELPDIRKALAAETASIEATVPGESRRANGAVSMIENTVDAGTGMVAVRATMPNTEELLWPGTLVSVSVTLREDESVTVPSSAVQISQAGTFVFVVKDGKASVRPVKVARTVGQDTALASGVEAGEVVVTDGFLLLTDGARVQPRQPRPGA
jgi:RND family efflux transporter MFP subunit